MLQHSVRVILETHEEGGRLSLFPLPENCRLVGIFADTRFRNDPEVRRFMESLRPFAGWVDDTVVLWLPTCLAIDEGVLMTTNIMNAVIGRHFDHTRVGDTIPCTVMLIASPEFIGMFLPRNLGGPPKLQLDLDRPVILGTRRLQGRVLYEPLVEEGTVPAVPLGHSGQG